MNIIIVFIILIMMSSSKSSSSYLLTYPPDHHRFHNPYHDVILKIIIIVLTYLSSSHPSWCKGPLSNFSHFVRALAEFSAFFQELHPSWFLSIYTVFHYVGFDFLLFLLFSGPRLLLCFCCYSQSLQVCGRSIFIG